MSHDSSRSGPQLPQALLQKLGLDAQPARRRNSLIAESRKAQRKEQRAQRGANNASKYQQHAAKVSRSVLYDKEPDEKSVQPQQPKIVKPTRQTPEQVHLKSTTKQPARVLAPASPSEDTNLDSRALSPGLVLDSTSRAFKERAAQDEDEIVALEKKLGLKSKKLPQSFNEDGLGDILNGLDGSGDDRKKRKREEEDWLDRKRRNSQSRRLENKKVSTSEEDDLPEDLDELSILREDDVVDEDNFGGFSEDQQVRPSIHAPRKRENPYVAPMTGLETLATKYIPPSLRKTQDQDSEALIKIRRQLQGHLNKLSEANLISILKDVEKMYQNNARQDVTSTLTELLVALFSDRSSLQSTFVILHASFIAAVYKVIGIDFGAAFISKLVDRLNGCINAMSDTSGKETNNLISLLAYLFTFSVINSTLLFDFLRVFLDDLNEINAELVLRIVRDCGPQLRQDDPSSLKRIVQQMQNASAKIAADGKPISVRTRFMIETITDLKNNKMRNMANNAGVASEHITQMRKVLGSLNDRNVKGSEPLRISRIDIQDSDKKGKWWLVGASWSNTPEEDEISMLVHHDHINNAQDDFNTEDTDLLALARQYRMNTDIRRSIFVSIMSATDYQDAHMRLLKLRLKRVQEQEIPKVLIRCAGAEHPYNLYYTLVAKKLCSEKKMKKAFQFSIWDFFQRLGENGDGDDDDSANDDNAAHVELREIVNLAKMYADLIVDGALTVGILKVLNLALLKEQAKTFVEVMFITMMLGPMQQKPPSEQTLADVFGRAADSPQLVKSLQYFIRNQLRKSDLVAKQDRDTLKWACGIAMDTLSSL